MIDFKESQKDNLKGGRMSSLSHRTVISSPALIGRKTCNIWENNRHFPSETQTYLDLHSGITLWDQPCIGVWVMVAVWRWSTQHWPRCVKSANNINNWVYSHLSFTFSKSVTSSMQLKFPTRKSGFCPSSNSLRATNLVPLVLKQSIIDEWCHRVSMKATQQMYR